MTDASRKSHEKDKIKANHNLLMITTTIYKILYRKIYRNKENLCIIIIIEKISLLAIDYINYQL